MYTREQQQNINQSNAILLLALLALCIRVYKRTTYKVYRFHNPLSACKQRHWPTERQTVRLFENSWISQLQFCVFIYIIDHPQLIELDLESDLFTFHARSQYESICTVIIYGICSRKCKKRRQKWTDKQNGKLCASNVISQADHQNVVWLSTMYTGTIMLMLEWKGMIHWLLGKSVFIGFIVCNLTKCFGYCHIIWLSWRCLKHLQILSQYLWQHRQSAHGALHPNLLVVILEDLFYIVVSWNTKKIVYLKFSSVCRRLRPGKIFLVLTSSNTA